MMKRVLSGIQPTAESLHLGNYLGAVKQWVELQSGNDAFYCIVDLHALTVETEPATLRRRTLAAAAQLIALGLDPKKCTLFIQSHLSEHNQLGWIFECITGFGEASRMTDRTVVGLFTYPMLQAADILLYQANSVPVGEDQRQHIELTRDLAQRFNAKYGEVFTIPEAHIIKTSAKINDLQDPNAKMSKSAASNSGVIDILDSAEINTKKIKSAVTDTGKEIKFDEKNKPGISNLLTIHSTLSGKSIASIEAEFAGKGYGDFKSAVAEVVTEFFRPVKTRTEELLEDERGLSAILEEGSAKAREVAAKTLKNAYDALGLVPGK
jgi:tryptophanyl-tRNA synthetase